MTIQVGDLIVRKHALMLPTNDTGICYHPEKCRKKIFAAKQKQLVQDSPRSGISLSSTNYFLDPPGGMSKQKNSFTPYQNLALENRPEQALIRNRGRRFEIAHFAR